MHVRQSRTLDELVYGESIATGTRMPNAPRDPGMLLGYVI